mmetsp:Transcript_6152/g.16988  ORF Transcript_6152/g.16988 Transcript_6152/m.16988 type:complete len:501 (-) Transcript_6152:102-1604(-)
MHREGGRCTASVAAAGRALVAAALLLWCCDVVTSGADIPEEDGVLVLNDKTFEAAVKSNPFILVEFYAPWCGHCKQFAPEYAAAAKQLKQATPPVPLAKVDATAEHKLAEEHGVRGYPTVRLFIDGQDMEYTGGRTEQSIVTWVVKKTGDAAIALPDVAAAEDFEKDNKLGVVGLFDESSSRTAFETAARQVEDVMFAYSTAAPVLARYKVQAPALRMFFPHDEQVANFEGDMSNVEEIERFVKSYRQPLVIPFDGETAADIFGDGRAIVVLFRDNDDKGKQAETELRKAAPGLGRKQLVTIAGSSEPMDQRLMDYVSVEPEELPTVRLVTSPVGSMTKYRLEGGEITEATLLSFVHDFEAGKLKPHMKSESPPMAQNGPVFTLVGSTFETIVKDPAKDVLVEFYAPWCGHCKKLEPVYREVAKRLEGVGTVVIAKIDATANDVAGVDIEGFPTIKLWRADNKADPLDYDGDRDVDSFLAWLEEKATHPFNRDELTKNEL